MKKPKKNRKNKPSKPKRGYRKKLSDEGMDIINHQHEVTFFDKWGNYTRANKMECDLKLIEDNLCCITPWLDKKVFFSKHRCFRINLLFVDTYEPLGEGLLVLMKCGGKAKVTKKAKMEFINKLEDCRKNKG